MKIALWGRIGACAGLLLGSVAMWLESTFLLVLALAAALATAAYWVRWTWPHNHWAGYRRRTPGDP
jgi:hypothetical protein